MALPELKFEIPDKHKDWTDNDYAGKTIISLAKAGLAAELDLKPENQSITRMKDAYPNGVVQQALIEAMSLCIEWNHRREWGLGKIHGYRLDWNRNGLLFMMAKASEHIGGAFSDAINHNPARAREFLGSALAYMVGFYEAQGWTLEEDITKAIQSRNNGTG